jgi:hypothetical protein
MPATERSTSAVMRHIVIAPLTTNNGLVRSRTALRVPPLKKDGARTENTTVRITRYNNTATPRARARRRRRRLGPTAAVTVTAVVTLCSREADVFAERGTPMDCLMI